MALAERALASNTDLGSVNQTITFAPTGQQEGDWVIVFLVTVGGAATHTNTAGGFSRAHAADFAQSGTTVSTWKKKCGAGESGTSYQFGLGGSNRRVTVAARCYSGGDATDIVDVLGALEGDTAQSLTLDSVDPSVAGTWHLLLTGSASAGGGSVNFDPPAGYTEKHDFASPHATLANACLGWSEDDSPTDPTGTQVVGITGGANRAMAGGSIVLKPAPPDATVAPAVIACTTAVPRSAVGVGVAPVVAAAVTALAQPGIGVGVAPSPVAGVVALPAPAVSIGVAPAVLAAVVALPLAAVSVTVAPAVLAAVVAFPQPAIGVGVSPAVIALLVAFPLPISVGNVFVNVNPDGPTMVGAIAYETDVLLGVTSRPGAMVGGVT